MKRLDEIAIEWECVKVIMQYAQAVNDWDIHKFVSLFVPDGIWQRPGVEPLHGRVEMLGFMKSQSRNRLIRHVNGGYVVTVEDDDRASAISQTTVYDTVGDTTIPSPLPGPDMVVEYRDKFVRIDDRWLIARRDTEVLFHRAVQPR